MATDNTSRYGFRPYAPMAGSAWPAPEVMFVATGYQATDADLQIGDPVKRVADGSAEIAIAGDPIYGVIVGVKPYWDGTKMTPGDKLPGGTAWGTIHDRQSQILVYRVDTCYWEVDMSAATYTTYGTYEAAYGLNFDHVFSIDSTAKKSHPRIDSTTGATTTAQWRLVRLSDSPENLDLGGLYVKVIVTPVEVQTQIAWASATGV